MRMVLQRQREIEALIPRRQVCCKENLRSKASPATLCATPYRPFATPSSHAFDQEKRIPTTAPFAPRSVHTVHSTGRPFSPRVRRTIHSTKRRARQGAVRGTGKIEMLCWPRNLPDKQPPRRTDHQHVSRWTRKGTDLPFRC